MRTLSIFLRNETSGDVDSHTCEVGDSDSAIVDAVIAWLVDVRPMMVQGDRIVIKVTEKFTHQRNPRT